MEYVSQVHATLHIVLNHVKPSRYSFWYAPWPHPMPNRPLDPSPAQNRYLTMGYMIWLTMGTYSLRCSKPTHPTLQPQCCTGGRTPMRWVLR